MRDNVKVLKPKRTPLGRASGGGNSSGGCTGASCDGKSGGGQNSNSK